MFEHCIGKKVFRESVMEKGCFFLMALLSTRTERFEIEMTAQIEGFKDNGKSLIFIIILIFYGQFCISFVPCSMFSLCWVGFFLPEVFFFF